MMRSNVINWRVYHDRILGNTLRTISIRILCRSVRTSVTASNGLCRGAKQILKSCSSLVRTETQIMETMYEPSRASRRRNVPGEFVPALCNYKCVAPIVQS